MTRGTPTVSDLRQIEEFRDALSRPTPEQVQTALAIIEIRQHPELYLETWRSMLREEHEATITAQSVIRDVAIEVNGLMDSLDDSVITDEGQRLAVYAALLAVFNQLLPSTESSIT